MKKSMVVLILAAIAIIGTSCSYYSCPTYTKTVKDQPAERNS